MVLWGPPILPLRGRHVLPRGTTRQSIGTGTADFHPGSPPPDKCYSRDDLGRDLLTVRSQRKGGRAGIARRNPEPRSDSPTGANALPLGTLSPSSARILPTSAAPSFQLSANRRYKAEGGLGVRERARGLLALLVPRRGAARPAGLISLRLEPKHEVSPAIPPTENAGGSLIPLFFLIFIERRFLHLVHL